MCVCVCFFCNAERYECRAWKTTLNDISINPNAINTLTERQKRYNTALISSSKTALMCKQCARFVNEVHKRRRERFREYVNWTRRFSPRTLFMDNEMRLAISYQLNKFGLMIRNDDKTTSYTSVLINFHCIHWHRLVGLVWRMIGVMSDIDK